MTSPQTSGPPPWRVAVAFGMLGMLALGVCAVSRSNPLPPSTSISASDTTTAPETTVVTSTTSPPATTQTSTTIVTTTATTDTTTGTTSAEDPLPGNVIAHTRAALNDWGEFAATRVLDVVESTFVTDGPQYEQLVIEAEEGPQNPDAEPYDFALTSASVTRVEREVAIVNATVIVSRNDVVEDELLWDIEMWWFSGEGRWRLYTVTTSAE